MNGNQIIMRCIFSIIVLYFSLTVFLEYQVDFFEKNYLSSSSFIFISVIYITSIVISLKNNVSTFSEFFYKLLILYMSGLIFVLMKDNLHKIDDLSILSSDNVLVGLFGLGVCFLFFERQDFSHSVVTSSHFHDGMTGCAAKALTKPKHIEKFLDKGLEGELLSTNKNVFFIYEAATFLLTLNRDFASFNEKTPLILGGSPSNVQPGKLRKCYFDNAVKNVSFFRWHLQAIRAGEVAVSTILSKDFRTLENESLFTSSYNTVCTFEGNLHDVNFADKARAINLIDENLKRLFIKNKDLLIKVAEGMLNSGYGFSGNGYHFNVFLSNFSNEELVDITADFVI